MFLYKEKLLNKLNTFVDESLSESKKSDDAILTGVVPTKDDIKLIIDAKTAFIANANDSAWAKKHFMQCPWGIAWNVSPVGRAPSAATALKYYLLALITDWTELETQLHRTLKQTYKFSVHEIEHITTVWDANIDAITVEVNNYLNTVTKTSITEHKVVNNNNPTQFYYLKPDIVFDIKRFNKKTIEALVELKHSNLPDMQLTQFVKRDADTNAWYSNDDKLRLLIIVLAMDWDQMFKILKKELKHYKYTKEDITAVFNYVADTTHIFDQVSALIHDAETEWSKHGSTKTFTKMYRVVLYDNGYTPPARRHVYITKTRPNGIRTIALGSSQMNSHSWYDEPLFDSAQQAQDFLNNLSKLQTRADTTRLSGKVTDKPIDGYVYNLDDALKVQTDLGPAYIHKRNGKFKEALREDVIDSDSVLFEDIEKHDTLNDKLFDLDTEKLRPEVKDKIEEIVSYFISDLAEDEIGIDVADIVLIGSNVSYNYTKDSDLDIHIIVDTTNSICPDNLYPKLYSAYRSLFNKKMNITLHGIPVELYVETEGVTKTVSNGIYSVMNDEWIKFPEHEDIPDIDMEEFDAAFAEWEARYNNIIRLDSVQAIEQYISDVYDLRQKSLSENGEYSIGNLIFKEVRNRGWLDNLKELTNILTSKELSLESLNEVLSLTEGDYGVYKAAFIDFLKQHAAPGRRDFIGKKDDEFDPNSYVNISRRNDGYFTTTTPLRYSSILHHMNGEHEDNAIIKRRDKNYESFENWANYVLIQCDNQDNATAVHRLIHLLSYANGGNLESNIKNKIKSYNPIFITVEKSDTGELIAKEWESFDDWWANCGGLPLLKHASKKIDTTEWDSKKKIDFTESKFRGYLTNSEIYAYRQDLERKLNTSVQVFNNGHFTINNVRESNVDELLRRIENIDFVLEAHKIESGKYDFNRMNFITGIPAKYYTINGKINLER